jgi:hypothetical protein
MKYRATRPTLRLVVCIALLSLGHSLSVAQGSGRDSVVSVALEPGVIHMTIFREGPLTINVLVVDLADTSLRLESHRPSGLVPTSRQAERNNRPGHKVVAAINADFFSKEGWPVNNQVENGRFVFGTQTQRSHLVVDNNGKTRIEKVSLDGWVRSKRGKVYPVAGINDAHRPNTVILHTSFSDSATNFSGTGMRFLLRLLNRVWSVGDTLRLVVSDSGSIDLTKIRADQSALWVAEGSASAGFGEDLIVGDTIIVYLGITPSVKNVRTILGGIGRIVSEGKPVEDSLNVGEKTSLIFLKARHPRTFVGFDKDTTKFFICTVDGRQPRSVGMSFREMADFLISIGVWNAMNFDGGGSTTMVVHGKIVNYPSDKTGERPVANTLQLIRMGSKPMQ